ncbi:hypothetical protein BH09ACT4_BH09ACT4_20060 [soil metagenome]
MLRGHHLDVSCIAARGILTHGYVDSAPSQTEA